MYRNAIVFYVMILYPANLMNLFIGSISFMCQIFGILHTEDSYHLRNEVILLLSDVETFSSLSCLITLA
jgi:exosortase/archaeosortase